MPGRMGIPKIIIAAATAAAVSAFNLPALAQYQFESKFGSFGTAPGQFDDPRGAAVDSDGMIIVTESGNHRVQLCTDTGTCTTFGSIGVESGQFDRPRGVAVNAGDRIFVADRGNDRIQSCSQGGSCDDFDGTEGSVGTFESPRGVVVDAAGQIVIADTDNDRIQICNDTGTACSGFGSFGTGLGQFNSPSGVAVDSTGRIIITDRGNHRIQVCSTTGSCSAFGGPGSAAGQFDTPSQVAVDSQDRIVVVDRFNDRIQVCSDSGACNAFGSTGSANGQFNLPWGVAVDANDRIIVADLGNNRIQIFSEPSAPPASITTFTAAPDTLLRGESTTLTWSVSNADSCTALNGTSAWRQLAPDPAGGSAVITVNQTGVVTFTLRCSGPGGTATRNVGITVQEPASTPINAGMNDAWFDPATAGQGFFIVVFPDIELIFLAWFTYDLERPDSSVTANLGEPGHRWLTAQGSFSGNTADLDIFLTAGGLFDSAMPAPDPAVDVGDMTITWHDCKTATLSYDIPGAGVAGNIEITRIALDNVALCEALAEP